MLKCCDRGAVELVNDSSHYYIVGSVGSAVDGPDGVPHSPTATTPLPPATNTSASLPSNATGLSTSPSSSKGDSNINATLDAYVTFDELLRHPKWLLQFEDHCRKEVSCENLYFWESVRE